MNFGNPRGFVTILQRLLPLLAALVVLKVTMAVVAKYGDYLPPNFQVDFLRGREAYFPGAYHWAFYSHIAAGPVTLILGLLLVSSPLRQRLPRWHRVLGRVQVATVLLLVAPSGLWMAFYAQQGASAAAGFATLAGLTAICTAVGWRLAVRQRFAEHRRWMWRSYLLLCSAVVIRLVGGAAEASGAQLAWIDYFTPWLSWMTPLIVFEFVERSQLRQIRRRHLETPRNVPAAERETENCSVEGLLTREQFETVIR